jgi:hypothetical protein
MLRLVFSLTFIDESEGKLFFSLKQKVLILVPDVHEGQNELDRNGIELVRLGNRKRGSDLDGLTLFHNQRSRIRRRAKFKLEKIRFGMVEVLSNVRKIKYVQAKTATF